jgi:hypothetical protein
MHFKRRTFFASSFATITLGLTLYAYTNPGVAACVITDSNQPHSVIDEQLLSESRARIQNTFGAPRAKPIVIFFDDPNAFWPFKLNEYASTQFIGSKVCVMIGPRGQNPDVVAHELMHAEIADRVGGNWRRFTQLPVWFDEGLAMQVDFRSRYVLRDGAGAETKYVKALRSVNQFFVSDDELLTKNYASAKVEVALWVSEVGNSSVYGQLERILTGQPFDAVISGN